MSSCKACPEILVSSIKADCGLETEDRINVSLEALYKNIICYTPDTTTQSYCELYCCTTITSGQTICVDTAPASDTNIFAKDTSNGIVWNIGTLSAGSKSFNVNCAEYCDSCFNIYSTTSMTGCSHCWTGDACNAIDVEITYSQNGCCNCCCPMSFKVSADTYSCITSCNWPFIQALGCCCIKVTPGMYVCSDTNYFAALICCPFYTQIGIAPTGSCECCYCVDCCLAVHHVNGSVVTVDAYGKNLCAIGGAECCADPEGGWCCCKYCCCWWSPYAFYVNCNMLHCCCVYDSEETLLCIKYMYCVNANHTWKPGDCYGYIEDEKCFNKYIKNCCPSEWYVTWAGYCLPAQCLPQMDTNGCVIILRVDTAVQGSSSKCVLIDTLYLK